MPIYEYKCKNGHVFDVMQRMSDDPLKECCECAAAVKKVRQPVGISFKGSGFYSTDYSSKAGPKTEPKEAAATSTASGDSSNGSSSSEKKPEKASTGAKKED